MNKHRSLSSGITIFRTSKYIREQLEDAEPVENGWTNRVYKTKNNTIIKVFSRHFLQATLFALADLAHGKANFPYWKERLSKEVKIKKVLEEEGYDVPSMIYEGTHSIEIEKIEGDDLKKMLENSNPDKSIETGKRIGDLISSLHRDNYSLGDTDFSNFYITENKVYTIDHEYASLSSDNFDKKRDIIHLTWSALELDYEKCAGFLEGFTENYREIKPSEIIASTCFSIISSIVTMNMIEGKKACKNGFKILNS